MPYIDACIQLKVPLAVFHHDPSPKHWVQRLRAAGIPVWMQASSLEITEAAIELGVDGIVAQGSEAGGHARGTIPLHTMLKTIHHRWPDMLLLAAGGISDGSAVAAALRLGADGVRVGTALVATMEANAHPEYQRRLIESSGTTLRPNAFGPERPDQSYRLLATPAVRQATHDTSGADPQSQHSIGRTRIFPHSLNLPYEMPFRSTFPPTPETTGDWDSMVYPAGQDAAAIQRIAPAAEVVADMMHQARHVLAARSPLQPHSPPRQ
ncbi:nitronate monooxygenase [Mycobacterium marseillense]|uniref:NAD(P)H-dependent flavin oxidoreductase n=1 Tax=Mycobacterium marseillense TaxID=701042 RepID=UPI002599F72A|nr:nitronate monooxygenase [Mycobacterium marseillense]MDM3975296.1 nitronate monooxygenase [Mycobacterium marseillense]